MGFLYIFYNKENIIYIGKTEKDLFQRLKQHNHLPEKCYNSITKIMYSKIENLSDLAVLEDYLICLYHPIYNTYNNFSDNLSFKINFSFNWKELDLDLIKFPLTKEKVSEEERLQRQREGIAIAKAQGKYKGRQRIKINEDKFRRLCKEWREGKRTAVSIQREMNITSQTFYRRVNEWNL